MDAAAAAKSLQSCPTLCDPTDGSPPDPLVPGSLQAKILEWVDIFFFNAWKWKVKVKSLSHVWLFATPWTAAYQAPLSMGFSRQEYWSGVPLPSPDEWIDGSYLITWTNFGLHYLLITLLCSQTSRRGQVSVLCIPRTSSALLGLSVNVCLSHKMLSLLWWTVSIVHHCVSSS